MWLDNETLVALVVPPGRGPRPQAPTVPIGPKIQDNTDGRVSQNRTYPDLLKDEFDERLFEYYCQSNIVRIQVSVYCC